MTNTIELDELLEQAAEQIGCPAEALLAVIDRGLAEDLADGPDLTTQATVPIGRTAVADLTPRQPGVLAGGLLAQAVFARVAESGGDAVRLVGAAADGSGLVPGRPALTLQGPVCALLTAERTALNLLTHLSGIATTTRDWVHQVAGTGAVIRDSRKTLPGLRSLQKYAVRCGGGHNHRMSLSDAALIKDNHVLAAGSVTAAVAAVRALAPDLPLEVEVDTLDQLAEALAAGVDLVLLDNFDLADTRSAVMVVRGTGRATRLESSGGLTLGMAAAYAATGVDFLAVGALTHSVVALDLGLDLRQG